MATVASPLPPPAPRVPPYGTINLSDKQVPICHLFPANNQSKPLPHSSTPSLPPLCVTRAQLDVSAFKKHLLDLPEDTWNDDCQDGNVKLMRPAHDKWGIKKIVFTFCDDFLLKVLDLPWSTHPSWEPHLDAIYESIGVDKKKVVRSLLASMPPGVDIPIHHDTGLWVKHCHRIHVPIITGPEVRFQVGANEESMADFLFDEGRVVELNNQSKHAVSNNMKTQHRVHLIFDYVDDYPLSRYTVKPGQKIVQTRRSIDFDPNDPLLKSSDATEEVTAALKTLRTGEVSPSFIIIGAQKSGTTSLYEYICEHPLVCKGKRRETHYFDWRWNDKLSTPSQHLDYYLNFYHREALNAHASIVTGESTPSYMLHSDIVLPRLKSTLPANSFKLLVMLRNPTSRAYSHYNMSIDMTGTPEQNKNRGSSSYINTSFEDIVDREISALVDLGISPDTDYETFKEKVLKGLPMGHGGHSIVLRGLYVLQLAPWVNEFSLDDKMKVFGLKEIIGTTAEVQEKVNSVYDFIGLPPHDIPDVEAKNTRSYNPINPETKNRLDEFYAPFNAKLFEMLGRELNW